MAERSSTSGSESSGAAATPSRAGAAPPSGAGARGGKSGGGVADTVISLVISLAMAFVAKSYVIEAYRIPTGSMAPTLLGAHLRFDGPQTGYDWATDAWQYDNLASGGPRPLPLQGGRYPVSGRVVDFDDPAPADPMTGALPRPSYEPKPGGPIPEQKRTNAGDRILVQKYLYEVSEPERFDVAVFKNPSDATVNYIKRLGGLPNEALWIVAGDVFAMPLPGAGEAELDAAFRGELAPGADGSAPVGAPEGSAWSIRRKPWGVQRAVWREVFSSEHTPLDPLAGRVRPYFERPWEAVEGSWAFDVEDGPVGSYRVGEGGGVMRWDSKGWPVTDMLPFNDVVRQDPVRRSVNHAADVRFPVSDVRVRFDVVPAADGVGVGVVVAARQRRFELAVGGGMARVRVRSSSGAWETLAEAAAPELRAGEAVSLEFWHADQALSVVIDGEAVIRQAGYEMGPAERVRAATGASVDAFMVSRGGDRSRELDAPSTYVHEVPEVTVAVTGGGATLHRVGLDKDIFYRPNVPSGPGLALHPERIAVLRADEFFALGDNSGASLDSRGWRRDSIDPWVERNIAEWSGDDVEPGPGVVPRRLLLGKAFFVYWPSVQRPFNLFVPDFGRMRLIR